jgi:hypothetical protein
MGKLAGATLTAVAPEAKLATKAAGAASGAGRRRPPVPDPRVTHPGSEAARQRQAVEDIKARRKAREDIANNPKVEPDDDPNYQPPAPPPPAGGGPSLPAMPAAASTGSGFLLGVFAWGLVLSYLGVNGKKSGADGVRAFLAAKFLNKA